MRRINPIPSTVLATLAASLALLPLLGHRPLTDWDEAIYAEVSREMLSLGWLVPHWNLQPWFEKPPLAMWLTAILFQLFGISEFTARAVSALCGIATVALLHGWLARSRDALDAWLSTAILLGTFGFLHACHVGETDTLLTLACMIALIGLTKIGANQIEAERPTGWYLFWIGFALALMTKGAASVVLPLTAIACAAFKRFRLGRSFWLGLALMLLLVLPWHLAMFHLYGHQFLDEYLGLHVLARTTHQIEGHTTPWWYFFKVLLVSAPPFVLLCPIALAKGFGLQLKIVTSTGAQRSGETCNRRPFAMFALVILALYTVVQTRLPQYIVPAYPAIAVLTAMYLGDRLRPLLAATHSAAFWIKLAFATAAIAAASILATTPARKSLHSATLADGTIRADNKDSIAILRAAVRNPQPVLQNTSGPLLLWRQGRISSVAPDVFYSRREVRQIELAPIPPGTQANRYTFNPEAFAQAVTTQPSLILLDQSLVPQIPSAFNYTPIQANAAMQLGTISRKP